MIVWGGTTTSTPAACRPSDGRLDADRVQVRRLSVGPHRGVDGHPHDRLGGSRSQSNWSLLPPTQRQPSSAPSVHHDRRRARGDGRVHGDRCGRPDRTVTLDAMGLPPTRRWTLPCRSAATRLERLHLEDGRLRQQHVHNLVFTAVNDLQSRPVARSRSRSRGHARDARVVHRSSVTGRSRCSGPRRPNSTPSASTSCGTTCMPARRSASTRRSFRRRRRVLRCGLQLHRRDGAQWSRVRLHAGRRRAVGRETRHPAVRAVPNPPHRRSSCSRRLRPALSPGDPGVRVDARDAPRPAVVISTDPTFADPSQRCGSSGNAGLRRIDDPGADGRDRCRRTGRTCSRSRTAVLARRAVREQDGGAYSDTYFFGTRLGNNGDGAVLRPGRAPAALRVPSGVVRQACRDRSVDRAGASHAPREIPTATTGSVDKSLLRVAVPRASQWLRQCAPVGIKLRPIPRRARIRAGRASGHDITFVPDKGFRREAAARSVQKR